MSIPSITQHNYSTEAKELPLGASPSGSSSHYNERIAKSVNQIRIVSPEEEERKEAVKLLSLGRYKNFGEEGTYCGSFAKSWVCEYGHTILMTINCGREWCPVCGADDSAVHRRRVSRMAAKVFTMDTVAYMIFEVRLSQRWKFTTKAALQDARKYIQKMLVREGVKRGVSRWHYYGEPNLNEYESELNYTKFHPHLNVLCECGYIGSKRLKRIRRLWSSWLKQYCGTGGTAPVYTQYCRSNEKRYHWLKYINRSTFKELNSRNRWIASELFGFNNCSWFGSFSPEEKLRGVDRYDRWRAELPKLQRDAKPDVRAVETIAKGHCPVCGEVLHLQEGVVKTDTYELVTDYGGGFSHVEER